MHDQADAQAQEAVHLAHPLAVAAGQVVVDGDDVHALARQSVEVGGQHGHQGLALTGLHLGDAPLVQDDAADQLDPEGAHAQYAPAGLPHGGEGLRQDAVQILAVLQALLEFVRFGAQLLVRHGGAGVSERFYLVGNRGDALELPIRVASEKLVKKSHASVCLSFGYLKIPSQITF